MSGLRFRPAALILAFLLPASHQPSRAQPSGAWSVGASVFVEEGDYGTDSRTTTVYVPTTIRRFFGAGDLEWIVPFLSVSTEGEVLLLSGIPHGKSTRPAGSSTVQSRETTSGLGDIRTKGRLYLCEDGLWLPQTSAFAQVKFPTASQSRHLGTGEWDGGGGLELTKTLAERWLILADAGYTWIGCPPDLPLKNQWNYAAGAGYSFIPFKWMATAVYEERSALLAGESNAADIFNDRGRCFLSSFVSYPNRFPAHQSGYARCRRQTHS